MAPIIQVTRQDVCVLLALQRTYMLFGVKQDHLKPGVYDKFLPVLHILM